MSADRVVCVALGLSALFLYSLSIARLLAHPLVDRSLQEEVARTRARGSYNLERPIALRSYRRRGSDGQPFP